MEKNKKKRKRKKTIFFLLLFVMAAGILCFTRFSLANLTFSGFGWIGNNLAGGVDTGDPAVGWLSFSSGQSGCTGAAYAVTLGGSQGQSVRPVQGYGWFGIGSENVGATCRYDRQESLGWVNFQAGPPPVTICNPAVSPDCHSAEWHDGDGDRNNGFAGYVDGWAKIVSMSPPYNTADDGWIRLKGSNYGLSLGEHGEATSNSYVWNSGGTNSSVGDNAGLGWIKLANAEICSIAFASESQTVSAPGGSLLLLRNRPAGFPVTVNLWTDKPARISFPVDPPNQITFRSKQDSYNLPISISSLPDGDCSDLADVKAQSDCGQSTVKLSILRQCSTKCSPGEVTIMPGETATFSANVEGYPGSKITWSHTESDCIDPTETSCLTGATCTIGIYTTTPGGKYCALQSLEVSASSDCVSCGSESCTLTTGRPGWIETNP